MDPEPPRFFLQLLLVDPSTGTHLIAVFLLVFVAALFSGAEVSFFSISEDIANSANRTKRHSIVEKLLSKPKKLSVTLFVTKISLYVCIIILLQLVNYHRLEEITSLMVTVVLILFFCEIFPKIHAGSNRIKHSLFMAYPVLVLDFLLTPISLPIRSAIISINKRYGRPNSQLSVDQLSQALDLTSKGDTTQDEQQILQGIVTFGNTDTKQVMKPRMEIFALRDDLTYKEILPQVIEQGFSRIPVYKESLDHITGILYVKDLVPHIDVEEFNWTTLLREAYFVPENKKLDDLLNEFKEKHIHLAIVVDEYGGTSGLISLEDLIEEIVGEISDEFDVDDLTFSKIDNNNFIFEGKTALKDFYKAISAEDTSRFEDIKGEAETLAGLLLEINQTFPKKGDIITFHEYSFTVEAFEFKRIKRIRLIIKK